MNAMKTLMAVAAFALAWAEKQVKAKAKAKADKAAHKAVWAENRAALQSFYAVHSAQLKAIEQAILAARKVKDYDRIAKIRNEQKKPLIKEIHQSYAMWLEAKKEINS